MSSSETRTFSPEAKIPPALRHKVYEDGLHRLPGLIGTLGRLDTKLRHRRVARADKERMRHLTPDGIREMIQALVDIDFLGSMKKLGTDFPDAQDHLDRFAQDLRPVFDPARWRRGFVVPPYPDVGWWFKNVGDPKARMLEEARVLFTLYHTRSIPNNKHHRDEIIPILREREGRFGAGFTEYINLSDVWGHVVNAHL